MGVGKTEYLATHELKAIAETADEASQEGPLAVLHVPEVLLQGRLWSAQNRVIQEEDIQQPVRKMPEHVGSQACST